MKSRNILLGALLGTVGTFGATTNVWVGVAGTTPDTAGVWIEPSNWKDGQVPVDYDAVKMLLPSRGIVKLPDDQILGNIESDWDSRLILLGERLLISSAGFNLTPRIGGGWFYADIALNVNSSDYLPWIQNNNLCGRITGTKTLTPASGLVSLRLDRFATSTNPIRTDDLQDGMNICPGNASFAVYVAGAAASSSAWSQTESSPYLVRADASAPYVAAGATVTGAGIPEGTFVRRVFTEVNALELSQPVTATSASNRLAFAEFHPDAYLHAGTYSNQGQNQLSKFKLARKTSVDKLVLEVDTFSGQAASRENYIHGLDASDIASWLPGTLRLHAVTGGGGGEHPTDWLENCHIEFAGTSSGGATTFPASRVVGFHLASATARLTVPEEKTGVITVFTNFTGMVVKDGAGLLQIGIAEAVNTGSITVEEGTLELSACATAGTDGVSFKSVTLAAGAVLKIPAEGLTVQSATFGDGATLRGPGTLTINGTKTGSPNCLDGAVISVVCGTPGAYVHEAAAEVAGHPAFWVDASKPETIEYTTEEGVNYVTRWNDWREGEPMFCTNIVRRPRFINGETMAQKYIKIEYVNTHWQTNTQGLVWSKPIDGIKAVFMVQDPSDGGGTLLGATGARLPTSKYAKTQGGVFYRTGTESWSSIIARPDFGTYCVIYGRIFLNGQERDISTQGFLGAYPQVVDFHVNTNYAVNAAHYDLACDAFGTGCYLDGHQYGNDNGRQRLSEVLIYTNSLTHVERVQTALYLSRKWLGRDIVYEDVDTKAVQDAYAASTGEQVSVPGNTTAGFAKAEAGTPLVKNGEGRLVVSSLDAGEVRVNAGELVVKSLSLKNSSVPGAPWVHMDASDLATLTTNASGVVQQWANLNGDGQTYRALTGSPKLKASASPTGLPTVDCGIYGGANKAAMMLYKQDGTKYAHDNNNSYITGVPCYKSVLIAYGSSGGGGSLLGCWGNGFPWQGFGHAGTGDNLPVITASDGSYTGWKVNDSHEYTLVTNGTWQTCLNGVPFNPFVTPYSGGFDVFSFNANNTWRKSDTLATYGQGCSYVGGLDYGEVLIYSNQLDRTVQSKIGAYLMKKWKGEDTPGALVARCSSLVVADGATVKVGDWAAAQGANSYEVGDGVLTTDALGGGGMVVGDVTLNADGVYVAEIANGALPTLTVDGSLALPAMGTLRITGDAMTLEPGHYVLASCAGLAPDALAGWMVDAPEKPHRSYRVSCAAGALVVDVAQSGTALILR